MALELLEDARPAPIVPLDDLGVGQPLVGEDEARVTDVAAPFHVSLNAISKHIRVLEGAGLVRRRVAGREHHLAFDPRPLEAAADWIAAQRAYWEPRLAALEEHLVRSAQTVAGNPPTRKPRR